VARTRPLVKGLVLMAPYMIELNGDDRMRQQMDKYGEVVRILAARSGDLWSIHKRPSISP